MVTAYADGFMAVWDLKTIDEVRPAVFKNLWPCMEVHFNSPQQD